VTAIADSAVRPLQRHAGEAIIRRKRTISRGGNAVAYILLRAGDPAGVQPSAKPECANARLRAPPATAEIGNDDARWAEMATASVSAGSPRRPLRLVQSMREPRQLRDVIQRLGD
jgi:hypothetical protein